MNKPILNKDETIVKVNELQQFFNDGFLTESELNRLLDQLCNDYIVYMPAITEAKRTIHRIQRQFQVAQKYNIPQQELRA